MLRRPKLKRLPRALPDPFDLHVLPSSLLLAADALLASRELKKPQTDKAIQARLLELKDHLSAHEQDFRKLDAHVSKAGRAMYTSLLGVSEREPPSDIAISKMFLGYLKTAEERGAKLQEEARQKEEAQPKKKQQPRYLQHLEKKPSATEKKYEPAPTKAEPPKQPHFELSLLPATVLAMVDEDDGLWMSTLRSGGRDVATAAKLKELMKALEAHPQVELPKSCLKHGRHLLRGEKHVPNEGAVVSAMLAYLNDSVRCKAERLEKPIRAALHDAAVSFDKATEAERLKELRMRLDECIARDPAEKLPEDNAFIDAIKALPESLVDIGRELFAALSHDLTPATTAEALSLLRSQLDDAAKGGVQREAVGLRDAVMHAVPGNEQLPAKIDCFSEWCATAPQSEVKAVSAALGLDSSLLLPPRPPAEPGGQMQPRHEVENPMRIVELEAAVLAEREVELGPPGGGGVRLQPPRLCPMGVSKSDGDSERAPLRGSDLPEGDLPTLLADAPLERWGGGVRLAPPRLHGASQSPDAVFNDEVEYYRSLGMAVATDEPVADERALDAGPLGGGGVRLRPPKLEPQHSAANAAFDDEAEFWRGMGLVSPSLDEDGEPLLAPPVELGVQAVDGRGGGVRLAPPRLQGVGSRSDAVFNDEVEYYRSMGMAVATDEPVADERALDAGPLGGGGVRLAPPKLLSAGSPAGAAFDDEVEFWRSMGVVTAFGSVESGAPFFHGPAELSMRPMQLNLEEQLRRLQGLPDGGGGVRLAPPPLRGVDSSASAAFNDQVDYLLSSGLVPVTSAEEASYLNSFGIRAATVPAPLEDGAADVHLVLQATSLEAISSRPISSVIANGGGARVHPPKLPPLGTSHLAEFGTEEDIREEGFGLMLQADLLDELGAFTLETVVEDCTQASGGGARLRPPPLRAIGGESGAAFRDECDFWWRLGVQPVASLDDAMVLHELGVPAVAVNAPTDVDVEACLREVMEAAVASGEDTSDGLRRFAPLLERGGGGGVRVPPPKLAQPLRESGELVLESARDELAYLCSMGVQPVATAEEVQWLRGMGVRAAVMSALASENIDANELTEALDLAILTPLASQPVALDDSCDDKVSGVRVRPPKLSVMGTYSGTPIVDQDSDLHTTLPEIRMQLMDDLDEDLAPLEERPCGADDIEGGDSSSGESLVVRVRPPSLRPVGMQSKDAVYDAAVFIESVGVRAVETAEQAALLRAMGMEAAAVGFPSSVSATSPPIASASATLGSRMSDESGLVIIRVPPPRLGPAPPKQSTWMPDPSEVTDAHYHQRVPEIIMRQSGPARAMVTSLEAFSSYIAAKSDANSHGWHSAMSRVLHEPGEFDALIDALSAKTQRTRRKLAPFGLVFFQQMFRMRKKKASSRVTPIPDDTHASKHHSHAVRVEVALAEQLASARPMIKTKSELKEAEVEHARLRQVRGKLEVGRQEGGQQGPGRSCGPSAATAIASKGSRLRRKAPVMQPDLVATSALRQKPVLPKGCKPASSHQPSRCKIQHSAAFGQPQNLLEGNMVALRELGDEYEALMAPGTATNRSSSTPHRSALPAGFCAAQQHALRCAPASAKPASPSREAPSRPAPSHHLGGVGAAVVCGGRHAPSRTAPSLPHHLSGAAAAVAYSGWCRSRVVPSQESLPPTSQPPAPPKCLRSVVRAVIAASPARPAPAFPAAQPKPDVLENLLAGTEDQRHAHMIRRTAAAADATTGERKSGGLVIDEDHHLVFASHSNTLYRRARRSSASTRPGTSSGGPRSAPTLKDHRREEEAILGEHHHQTSLRDLKKLHDAGHEGVYAAAALRGMGYTAEEEREAGATAHELHEAGFSAAEGIDAGYTPTEMHEAGYSAAAMRMAGLSAAEEKDAGFSAYDLKQAGYRAFEVHDAGFDAVAAKAAEFTLSDEKLAGYTAKEIAEAGYTPAQMRDAGYTAAEMYLAGVSPTDLKLAGFTANELLSVGLVAEELRDAGFSAAALHKANAFKVAAAVEDIASTAYAAVEHSVSNAAAAVESKVVAAAAAARSALKLFEAASPGKASAGGSSV